ncbi:MAG: BlaI/MecI/CopY family transcriptional regulator [Oscillospiraceae bacterium]|nr:BlaI/MecI/CopY family transcriptional regulator [Oscillospiraceae bacterium]
MELTKNELQIMTVLWHVGKPLTGAEIRQQSAEKTWKDGSIHIILNKLLEKGALAEHGFIKDGKTIARTFVPAISRKDYYETHFAGYAPEDIPDVFSALLHTAEDDAELAGKLKDIIRAWEHKET